MPDSKRPFWMHQLVEYLLGLLLISFGARSLTPLMPCVLGALIVINAAITRGPMSAFRGIPRSVHRRLDVVLVVVAVGFALQPVVEIESAGRVLIVVAAGALVFLWSQSSFAEKVPRARRTRSTGVPVSNEAIDRGVQIGRTAGRWVGEGVNAVRRRTRG